MIKHFCDICNKECSGSDEISFESSYTVKTTIVLCDSCYMELIEYQKNMLRRNPNSYIHEIDKLITEAEVRYDKRIS